MRSEIIILIVLIPTIPLGVFTWRKFFEEKANLLSSSEFLSNYKQVYDSFAQSAGVPSVERLRYSGTFPPSAFKLQRRSKLTSDQKMLLSSYRSFVKKAYGYLVLAILFIIITFLLLLYLVFLLL